MYFSQSYFTQSSQVSTSEKTEQITALQLHECQALYITEGFYLFSWAYKPFQPIMKLETGHKST